MIMVTGATGFVGGALVDALLAQGRRVRVLVRDPARVPARWAGTVDVRIGDLTENDGARDACAGIETVLHLAGYAHAEDEGSERSNELHRSITVEGTRRLVADAARHGVAQLVFLSSVKAIGESTVEIADETTAATPTTGYGRAKLEAEGLVLGAGRPAGIVVRSPLVYGPGSKGNLQRMITAVGSRRFPPVPRVVNRRSMIDVRDLVAALLLVARTPTARGRVFVATDGEAYSTRRLYEAICVALGRPASGVAIPLGLMRFGARLGDLVSRVTGRPAPLTSDRLTKLFGDAHYSNRALIELGFHPAFRFETALPEMIRETS